MVKILIETETDVEEKNLQARGANITIKKISFKPIRKSVLRLVVLEK